MSRKVAREGNSVEVLHDTPKTCFNTSRRNAGVRFQVIFGVTP